MTLATPTRPNLPPLFADDDWLWVAQSLGYVDCGSFEARHRMDRIIAKLLDYRAEDVRLERGGMKSSERVATLVDQIKGILAGHGPGVQGAALADCLAIWLAGHQIAGDEDATRSLRAELLAKHCTMVRNLVPANAAIMGTEQ